MRAGVLGHPIGHSRSPALHAAAYRALGLDVDYRAHDVRQDQLAAFVAGLDAPGQDWLGLSVTMPLKSAMVGYAGSLSPRVHRLGVLNTVVRAADGTRTAENTDVDGIVTSLSRAGVDQAGGRMGILGGGGTASAAVLAASQLGLDGVEILVRTPERVREHLALARGLGLVAEARLLRDFPTSATGLRAVVATLPPRAADPVAAALTDRPSSGAALPPLLDAAYDPWPSALAAAWHAGGGRVVSGLEMLLYQAVEQVRLFTARLRLPAAPDWAGVTEAMAAAVGLPERAPGA